jgi:hypothetical protein
MGLTALPHSSPLPRSLYFSGEAASAPPVPRTDGRSRGRPSVGCALRLQDGRDREVELEHVGRRHIGTRRGRLPCRSRSRAGAPSSHGRKVIAAFSSGPRHRIGHQPEPLGTPRVPRRTPHPDARRVARHRTGAALPSRLRLDVLPQRSCERGRSGVAHESLAARAVWGDALYSWRANVPLRCHTGSTTS